MDDQGAEVPGSARLELVAGVRLLHEEDAILVAMLNGWANRQRGGRGVGSKTVNNRRRTVERFVRFINEYPWQWTSGDVDQWMTLLVSEEAKSKSSLRNY